MSRLGRGAARRLAINGFAGQKGVRLSRKLLLAVEQRSPDFRGRCQVRQEVAERFDRKPFVVADVTQRRERGIPRDAARSRNASVVLGDVDVGDPVAGAAYRSGRVLLLDVRVERIEMEPAVGGVYLIYEADTLVETVHVVQLEAVDDLFSEHDVPACGVLGHAAKMLDTALPFFLGGALSGEHAECNL